MILERGRYAWAFDLDKTPDELLAAAAERVQVMNPQQASVVSLIADSTCRSLAVSNLPRPQQGPAVRPPAVAGVFYPEQPAALDALIDELITSTPDVSKEHCSAVMVPHAGLRYSGKIAAEVFKHIEIPARVIILAPKHTRLGTPWAVAPHETWAVPGQAVRSDPELARRLADAIPGLQLDAAAHKDEHAIEVQLPLLARLGAHNICRRHCDRGRRPGAVSAIRQATGRFPARRRAASALGHLVRLEPLRTHCRESPVGPPGHRCDAQVWILPSSSRPCANRTSACAACCRP